MQDLPEPPSAALARILVEMWPKASPAVWRVLPELGCKGEAVGWLKKVMSVSYGIPNPPIHELIEEGKRFRDEIPEALSMYSVAILAEPLILSEQSLKKHENALKEAVILLQEEILGNRFEDVAERAVSAMLASEERVKRIVEESYRSVTEALGRLEETISALSQRPKKGIKVDKKLAEEIFDFLAELARPYLCATKFFNPDPSRILKRAVEGDALAVRELAKYLGNLKFGFWPFRKTDRAVKGLDAPIIVGTIHYAFKPFILECGLCPFTEEAPELSVVAVYDLWFGLYITAKACSDSWDGVAMVPIETTIELGSMAAGNSALTTEACELILVPRHLCSLFTEDVLEKLESLKSAMENVAKVPEIRVVGALKMRCSQQHAPKQKAKEVLSSMLEFIADAALKVVEVTNEARKAKAMAREAIIELVKALGIWTPEDLDTSSFADMLCNYVSSFGNPLAVEQVKSAGEDLLKLLYGIRMETSLFPFRASKSEEHIERAYSRFETAMLTALTIQPALRKTGILGCRILKALKKHGLCINTPWYPWKLESEAYKHVLRAVMEDGLKRQ